jgi:hypothetical protein
MTNLQAALEYATRGWSVIPLHTARPNHTCTCGHDDCKSIGKHPRTKAGLKDASNDPEKIASWWGMWPAANIGVCTGPESGIIVMDIDDEELAKEAIGEKEIPETLMQETGSGGKHLVFAYPGKPVKSGTKIIPGVDSRADGGYIVVPPSNHKSGRNYEWLNAFDPAPAPSWWVDLIDKATAPIHTARTDNPEGSAIFEGSRNASLTSVAGSLRKLGLGYDEILAALLNRNANACRPPLDEKEVEIIARSVSGYAIKTPEEEELENTGALIAARLWDGEQKKKAETIIASKVTKAGPMPDGIIPSDGVLKDIYEYVMSISRKEQPLAALGAAISVVSTLMNRKYSSYTNLRANVFIATLIPSGQGKDVVIGVIPDLLIRAGAEKFVGGEPVSGTAIISALSETPVRCYALDEYGRYLAGVNNKNANTNKIEIGDVLTKIWSCSNKPYTGKERADRKTNKQLIIRSPYVVVNGVTVPDRFWSAITSMDASDGFLGRYIVFNSPDYAKTLFPEHGTPPQGLINKLKDLYEFFPQGGNLASVYSPEIEIDPVVIIPSPDARTMWEELSEKYSVIAFEKKQFSSIYNRVAENAMKLAMIYSASRDFKKPSMTLEAMSWGASLAIWSAETVVEQIQRCVADDESEKLSKQIIAIIEDAGPEGISPSILVRKKGLGKSRFVWTGILDQIKDSGAIFLRTRKLEGAGKPSIRWVSAQFFDEKEE